MLNILLPTDFSNNAQKAIDYAIYLLEKEACTFYLLNAYYIVPSAPGTKLDAGNRLELLQRKLEAAKNPLHRFERLLLTDTAVSAMEKTVANKDIDYLFMGTKGSSALREIFMGSVAVSVIKHIDGCPIIAVPGEYDCDIPDDILFASDFKHTFKALELAPLIKASSLWDSTINIVHINAKKELDNAQKSNKELLKKHLNESRHRFIKIKKSDSIVATIFQLEKEYKNIGMVALLKKKHDFFEKLTREPVIRNLTFKTEVPLLVLPQIE